MSNILQMLNDLIDHDCKAPSCATCFKFQIAKDEDVMLDAHDTFDADNRDHWSGAVHTVEQVNRASYVLGEQSLVDYERNRIALDKLAF